MNGLPKYNFLDDEDDNKSCGVEEFNPLPNFNSLSDNILPSRPPPTSSLPTFSPPISDHSNSPDEFNSIMHNNPHENNHQTYNTSLVHNHTMRLHEEDNNIVDDQFMPEQLHEIKDLKYIPYKYIVNDKKLIICTRSTDGSKHKFFAHRINNWSYINIPHGIHNVPKTIQYLRSILATDKVSFDKRTRTFVVEPSSAVNEKVESVSLKPITKVPLNSSTILARLDKRFFDPFEMNGEISANSLETPITVNKGKYCNLFCSGNVNFAAFKTVVWTTVDDSTIVFVYYNSSHEGYYKFSHSKVNIWTTFDNFNDEDSIRSAITSIKDKAMSIYTDNNDTPANELPSKHFEIDIAVKNFEKASIMLSEFLSLIEDHTDICVHYGENIECNLLGNRIMKTYSTRNSGKKASEDKVEFIDLKGYTSKIYSYLPSHEIYDIIKHIDLTEQGNDIRTNACIKSILDGSQFIGWQLPITSEVSTTENISFFIEKITAKCFIISKLYITMSKSIFEICQMSGCNPSEITLPGYAARGIVSTVNQIASCAQIVDKLPEDYIPPGFYPLTNVIPLSNILIDNMLNSSHELTKDVGNIVKSIKEHGWIIRDLYSLRSLKPLKLLETPSNIPGIFGYFNDMIYTTGSIRDFTPVCQWSSIINVGLGWIGITVPAIDNNNNDDITFGYFGIDDVCNHPFQALKNAVEMYLTLFISSTASGFASIPNPSMIAKSITLTDSNMKIRQSITSYNIDSYRNLILPRIAKEIESGNMEIYIDLWHCKDDQTFTTNQHKADNSVYKKIITETLVRSFECILRSLVEQSRHNNLNISTPMVTTTRTPNIITKQQIETNTNELPKTEDSHKKLLESPVKKSPSNYNKQPSTPVVEINLKGRDNFFKD